MSYQKYTIYLLKKAVKDFQAALDPEKQVSAHELATNLGFAGTLYVGNQNRFTPPWVELLNPFLKTPVQNALTANISAVLLVNYDNRIFAVTFGAGKSFLAASSWVKDFGLKVALNRIDPTKLRSLDTKTYEDMVVSKRKQTSRSSTVGTFELDVARDLLRGVTADSSDTTFYKRLSGSDSITLITGLEFKDFGDLLEELLDAYSQKKYKAEFGWIDNVKEVDPAILPGLDGLLLAALQSGATNDMHLAPADIVEWSDIEGFNYTGGKKTITYPELELVDYLDVLGDKIKTLTVEILKRHKVRVRREDSNEFIDQWAVYDCFVWETNFKGKKFVLFDSRWFEVEMVYARRVDAFVSTISKVTVNLPHGSLGQDEGDYNESVAQGNPNEFVLFDRELIKPDGAASDIEFCDLMSSRGQFIHVKKRSGSATLSHLFAQGSVSCDAFLRDAGVRAKVRDKLTKFKRTSFLTLIPQQTRPISSNYEVVYAVLAKSAVKWPPSLPFFSAVNLMHHASRIQNLGFKVSLLHVKQV